MSNNDQLRELLARRRDRSIATLLGWKEAEIDQWLPPELQAKLRKMFLDTFNDFYDMAMDVARSMSDQDTVVFNEHYLAKLDEIYEVVVTRDG